MITYKVNLYGGVSHRKTLQIRNLIERFGPENVHIVSAEDGLGTIRTAITEEMVTRVTSIKETRSAWAKCNEMAQNNHGLWVCVDGGSQIVEWIANEQLSGAEAYFDAKARGDEIKDSLKPFGRFIGSDGTINTMQVYGRIGRDSENLWGAWIKLPCNLYVNFLEDMTRNDGFKSLPPFGPDVPGKVGLKAVMSSFDFVMRLTYDAEGVLVAQLDPTKKMVYLSKTRNDRTVVTLPPEIPDFNLADFVDLISGKARQEAAAVVV